MLTLLRSCHEFNYNCKIVKLCLVKNVKFKIFLQILHNKLLLLDIKKKKICGELILSHQSTI